MTRAEKYRDARKKVMAAIDSAHTTLRNMEAERFEVRGVLLKVDDDGELVIAGSADLTVDEVKEMGVWLEKWFGEEV